MPLLWGCQYGVHFQYFFSLVKPDLSFRKNRSEILNYTPGMLEMAQAVSCKALELSEAGPTLPGEATLWVMFPLRGVGGHSSSEATAAEYHLLT